MTAWKRLMPRLTLFALCCTFLLIAINPVVRWSIIRSGKAVTGADVDVDGVNASWWNSQIFVSGFRAEDPGRPGRNLFDIDQVKMVVDPQSLVRRRIVVRRAEVSGLNLDTARTSNEVMTQENSKNYVNGWNERFERIGIGWIESATACLEDELPVQLNSSQLAESLLQPWPGKLASVEQEAVTLNERLSEINALLAASGDNPLRNATSYQDAILELGTVAKRMIDVRTEMDRLEQQVLMDKDQIATARENEQPMAQLERSVVRLDEAELSEYLLGREVSERVVRLVNWLRWGKQFLPALTHRSDNLASRGREILFGDPKAKIVIEDVVLRGAHGGGSPLQFEGRLQGLSSGVDGQQSPTELTVQTTNGTPCLIEARLHGSGKVARDFIHVNCPSLSLPARTLGNEKELAVDVAAADAHLWVELTTSGEALSGELIIKQPRVEFVSNIENDYRCSDAATVFARSVAEIDSLEVAVQITGTLDHPSWEMRSNLGPQLSAKLEQALTEQLLVRDQHSLERAYSATDQRIAALTEQIAAKRASIGELLTAGGEAIKQVQSSIASRVDLNDQMLENESPLRETLLR